MTARTYNVLGSAEIISEGEIALDKLRGFLETLGGDAEIAEIRMYENMPIECVIGTDDGFTTYVWTREKWEVER